MERREVLRKQIKILCRDLNLQRTPGLELDSVPECRKEIINLVKAYHKKQMESIAKHGNIVVVELQQQKKKNFLKRLFGF
ncbi:hypothetical protein IX317_000370 [Fusobacterium sp. DD29]|uniref:hypothetical protein n=1 Tax=unclassified Fusobacterium TaxID=2648384 RepID=UPI001B8AAD0C|nr:MULTISPECIES: hypothetical protein [unclassified Fusobacterium]MBR8748711.1 hypothetical protein [Fusobacterium sp. DD29]MBR8760937.1 hypothetical protein [Fusobacterium sp. DD25]MBR8766990.1 hypothetical protein [Fusobacterium sp. DD43]MBR8770991.1 hypothetical protein [Fusobacterium sp. DD40]MBR8775266.1 hypothetical protein [Fusobacterium sp. DD17]